MSIACQCQTLTCTVLTTITNCVMLSLCFKTCIGDVEQRVIFKGAACHCLMRRAWPRSQETPTEKDAAEDAAGHLRVLWRKVELLRR